MSLEDTLAKDARIVFWGRATDYDTTAKTLPDYRGSERAVITRAYGASLATTNAPTKTADWLSTGEPSMTFAGDEGLVGNFLMNSGAFAIIAAGSTASVATGFIAIFGNNDTTVDMRIGRNGARMYLFTGASGFVDTSNLMTVDTKHLMEWVVDPEGLGRSSRIDGADWGDSAMTTHSDIEESTTPSLGYTSTDKDFPFSGDIAEFFIVNVPTRDAPWTELGDTIRSYLATKYSITLP